MSEICEICGREKHMPQGCWREHHSVAHDGADPEDAAQCYRLGYERTLARADRYEAEFSACKALLIAAQQRGERAEAERAAAEARANDAATVLSAAEIAIEDEQAAHTETMELWRAAEQRASEARALAIEEAAQAVLRACYDEAAAYVHRNRAAKDIRALAALPVEPARRQVTEITQKEHNENE